VTGRRVVPQIEYGDFYKFIVSVGIALLIAAVLLPWLFLREPFDLLVDANQITHLTPAAQAILASRQLLLARAFHFVPWISGTLFIVGLALSIGGLLLWRPRQAIRDQSEDLDLEKRRRELKSMSAEQRDAKIEADIVQERGAPPPAPERTLSAELVSSTGHIRRLEQELHHRIKACVGSSYDVRVNQRLGAAEYDVILNSNIQGAPDVIIELKYIRQGFHYSWMRESASRLILATELYAERLHRKSVPLLLIITANAVALSDTDFGRMSERVNESLAEIRKPFRIVRILEDRINSIGCEELRTLLFG